MLFFKRKDKDKKKIKVKEKVVVPQHIKEFIKTCQEVGGEPIIKSVHQECKVNNVSALDFTTVMSQIINYIQVWNKDISRPVRAHRVLKKLLRVVEEDLLEYKANSYVLKVYRRIKVKYPIKARYTKSIKSISDERGRYMGRVVIEPQYLPDTEMLILKVTGEFKIDKKFEESIPEIYMNIEEKINNVVNEYINQYT